MTKQIEVMVWNVLDGLNDPAVQREITDSGVDVGIFPEAAKEENDIAAATRRVFANEGYELYSCFYSDDDGRTDRHVIALAAKPEYVHRVLSARLAGRTALRLVLPGGTDVLGVHLDDRTEVRRLRQTAAAVHMVSENALVAGDFNAMHRHVSPAGLLRVARPFTYMMPASDPGNLLPSAVPERRGLLDKLKRVGSLSQRLTGMALGTTLEAFEDAGFIDASEDCAATFIERPFPFIDRSISVQLDHVLYRGDRLAVMEPTKVYDGHDLSDHKQIRATFSLTSLTNSKCLDSA